MQPVLRLAAAAASLVLLAGCAPAPAVTTPTASSASGYAGAEITTPYQLPDVSLQASTGQDFNLRTGTDKPALVVYFGYTNCPDICLNTMTDLASAMNRVPREVRAKIQVLLVTVDPDRDTPAVLASYLARIDPDFIGLTGKPADIEKVAAALGVAIEGMQTHSSGNYDVSHSDQVIGIDAAREGVVVWTQGTSIGTFKADFERLVRQ